MTQIGVMLVNGNRHKINYEQSKEDFLDMVKFNRDNFVQDVEGYYILISSISVFRFE